MKKPLLFFLLLISISGQAQSWAPTGATWHFGIGEPWTSNVHYNQWISTHNTVLLGQNCRSISGSGTLVPSDISPYFIYADSNIVYWYNPVINQFTTLYDFNKTSGESWVIKADTCDLLVVVDSTGLDTINGFELKTLFISADEGNFSGKVIEFIGLVWRPLPDVTYYCNHIISDVNYYTGLRCYEDSTIGFVDFEIAPSCNYSNTSVEEIEDGFSFRISPNPASTSITLQMPHLQGDAEVYVFNSLGEQVLKTKVHKAESEVRIDVAKLPAGLYFVKMNNCSGMFVKE